MEPMLQVLDRQWPPLAASPEARRAVTRWADTNPVLAGMADLGDVLGCRHDPEIGAEVQRVLACLAPHDELAGRTLLQILLPGVVRLVATVGRDDPDAPGDLVALAWERIRTYPPSRSGSVAANAVLDVRKQYLKARRADRAASVHLIWEAPSEASPADDQVLAKLQLEEIIHAARRGEISPSGFDAIVRTRIGGESLTDVAASLGMSTEVLCQRRWRAEKRLRALPLAS